MREEINSALVILKRAMRVEQEGQEFYRKATEMTREEKGQETFRNLAADEREHFHLIQRQYDALASQGQWISSPEVKPAPIALDKPLFPAGREAFKKVVTTKSSDLDALLFGLEIENRSYDLYRTAASTTANSPGKDMFQFLAGEERRHFDTLMTRYESLAGPTGWQY